MLELVASAPPRLEGRWARPQPGNPQVTHDASTGGVVVVYRDVSPPLLQSITAYASFLRRNPTGWMARVKYDRLNRSATLRIFPTKALSTVLEEENDWIISG